MKDCTWIRNKVFLLFTSTLFFIVITTVYVKYSGNYLFLDALYRSSLEHSTTCHQISYEQLEIWFQKLTNKNQIPKIIHQTWKTSVLREKQSHWAQTWCQHYPNWYYRLWTDDENDRFVKEKFPWFYSTYIDLSPNILKVDSVRYLYMLHYGGMYVDLDYESIHSLEPLMLNKQIVFALLNYQFDTMNSIPNSWLASKPNQSLWMYIILRIKLKWEKIDPKEKTTFWNGKAEYFTGPQALYEGILFEIQYKQQTSESLENILTDKSANATTSVGEITFLGPKLLNGYDWMSGFASTFCSAESVTFDSEKCKQMVEPIYAITYWSHTYGHGHEADGEYLAKQTTSYQLEKEF